MAATVFLSYAREDEPRARVLVDALESQGVQVWWDRELVGGETWRDALESKIREASCVVALWSPRSVGSQFVRAEADLALKQGKLVPVLIERAEIPLPFGEIHTTDLSAWEGERESREFGELLTALRVRRRAGAGDAGGIRARRLRAAAWILLPSAMVAAAVPVLMRWPAPATVDIDVTARKMQVRSRGESAPLLQQAAVRSLALRGFQEVSVPEGQISTANPAKYDLRTGAYAAGAWSALRMDGPLRLRPVGADPATVTISMAGGQTLGVHEIFARAGAEIVLTSPEKDNVTLELRGAKQSGTLGLPSEFQMTADSCLSNAAAWPRDASTTLRFQLGGPRRTLEFGGSESGVVMALEYSPGHGAPILNPDLAVDRVEFQDLGRTGLPESTVSAGGTIRFEETGGADVKLKGGDFLILENLRDFLVRRVEFADAAESVRVRLYGTAGKVRSGPRDNVRSRGRSRFDQLWESAAVVKVFTILVWLIPTLIAARRFRWAR
jgi:hypothetical protein